MKKNKGFFSDTDGTNSSKRFAGLLIVFLFIFVVIYSILTDKNNIGYLQPIATLALGLFSITGIEKVLRRGGVFDVKNNLRRNTDNRQPDRLFTRIRDKISSKKAVKKAAKEEIQRETFPVTEEDSGREYSGEIPEEIPICRPEEPKKSFRERLKDRLQK